MNVYDTANRLAQEIKTSEEYMTYKKAKEYIDLKPELKEKIMDFQKLRYDAQISAMQTGKEDEEKLNKVQELYAELIQIDEVKRYFKGSVYTTLIPRNVRLAEAPSHGKPVIYYDSRCRGAVAYMELAEEFIK